MEQQQGERNGQVFPGMAVRCSGNSPGADLFFHALINRLADPPDGGQFRHRAIFISRIT
ncbi:MAG: hypothetical protein ABWY05_02560 [Noviherbaspirillum sp.]